MPATVIIGTQWGDEGKGKVVDLLAASADVVVRFHGGNNAGHTLVVNGEKTILNLVPAGVLHPGRICMLGPGVVIDPEVLVGEIESLRKRGYLAEDRWLPTPSTSATRACANDSARSSPTRASSCARRSRPGAACCSRGRRA